jgi:hypothetical protein
MARKRILRKAQPRIPFLLSNLNQTPRLRSGMLANPSRREMTWLLLKRRRTCRLRKLRRKTKMNCTSKTQKRRKMLKGTNPRFWRQPQMFKQLLKITKSMLASLPNLQPSVSHQPQSQRPLNRMITQQHPTNRDKANTTTRILQPHQEPAHLKGKTSFLIFQKGASLEQKILAENLGQLLNNFPDQSLEGLEYLWANLMKY